MVALRVFGGLPSIQTRRTVRDDLNARPSDLIHATAVYFTCRHELTEINIRMSRKSEVFHLHMSEHNNKPCYVDCLFHKKPISILDFFFIGKWVKTQHNSNAHNYQQLNVHIRQCFFRFERTVSLQLFACTLWPSRLENNTRTLFISVVPLLLCFSRSF